MVILPTSWFTMFERGFAPLTLTIPNPRFGIHTHARLYNYKQSGFF
jgi:hypothetical protein